MIDTDLIREELSAILATRVTLTDNQKGTIEFTSKNGKLKVLFDLNLFMIRYEILDRTGDFEHPRIVRILDRAIKRVVDQHS